MRFCIIRDRLLCFFFFFFNDTATTEIYTLSLHDALPISAWTICHSAAKLRADSCARSMGLDRKSTRLNSSHGYISYAVFCLKKKKKQLFECLYVLLTRTAQLILRSISTHLISD